MIDTDVIKQKLELLRRADLEYVVFGANGHRYELRPRVTASKVEEFEERYGIELPDDYRRYLTEVGNGGAGPYYGILGLGSVP